jgi:hypothetical protein
VENAANSRALAPRDTTDAMFRFIFFFLGVSIRIH